MKLADFIGENMDGILKDWEEFARSVPAAHSMESKQLKDHAESILRAIAHDMAEPQSDAQAAAKSKGQSDAAWDSSLATAAQEHASMRLGEGFSLPELVSEYRAMRASVIRRWRAVDERPQDAIDELVRFDEAIDQSLAESVDRFSRKLDRARELFMGILGHDLRGPLHVVSRGATYLQDPTMSVERRVEMAGHVLESAERMRRLIEDLLDVVRTRVGGNLPIEFESADAREICGKVIAELRAENPDYVFELQTEGDLCGTWDAGRIEQVFANLLSNAVAHGERERPITLRVAASEETLVARVHNYGEAIPEHLLQRIFEPLVQGYDIQRGRMPKAHLGLGLFIASSVVQAHGGSIKVQSTRLDGTTFAVSLPKHPTISH